MRRMGHPLEVETATDGRPTTLCLGTVRREVQGVLDSWVEAGRWWEGEHPRRFYRVDAGGRFDLSCDPDGQWRVEIAWD